jgi:hypothetical protein
MTYPRCRPILAWLFLCLLASPSAVQADNAIAEYQAIHQRLRAARANYEWSVSLASASDLNQLLNGSPNSLLEVARAKVHTDDLAGAFRDLEQFLRMGQATDLLASSPEFAPLRQKPDFGAIQTGMKENQSAVSLGTLVFRLSDPTLIPEDLDYDPNTKRFFITTVRGKKIITTDLAGTITEFAKAPDDWPLLAIKIDPRHGVLWASEVALTGFVFVPKADWGKSVVLGYDLKTGKLLHRIEGPHDSALGDMTITPDGDVIVSDGDGGGVYLIHAGGEGLERLDGGDFISPQTPAVPSDGKKIFVPDYLRGIGWLDVATKQVRWLNMEGRFALNGIDGLYLEGQTLLAVQNGTSPERVVAFQLDPTFSKVVSETIIERSTETLGDPTHGVIIGNDFYYIANSGWDVIDDQGNPKPGTHPSEALIMRVPLSAFQNR